MNKNLKKLFLIPVLLPLWAFAQNIRVEVLDSHPSAGSTLRPDEPMYVRLAYQSDMPLHFRLTGFANGVELQPSYAHPAPLQPAGNLETIVWTGYPDGTAIDELRVVATNENSETVYVLSLSWNMLWSEEYAESLPEPGEWIQTLVDDQQQPIARSLDQPAKDMDATNADFYSTWFWIMQLAVLLAGVLLAAWIEPGLKRIFFRRSAGKAADPDERIPYSAVMMYRARTGTQASKSRGSRKSPGVAGQAKNGGWRRGYQG